MGRERRAREMDMRDLCEMGVSVVVGRGGSFSESEQGAEERRGESGGRREMAERIWGVVVRRTIEPSGYANPAQCGCCKDLALIYATSMSALVSRHTNSYQMPRIQGPAERKCQAYKDRYPRKIFSS